MSRPNSITVSRSKRGTTVHARGAAAQALFDSMAQRKDFEAGVKAAVRPPPHQVHFQDQGQDFLRWDVDGEGVVTASWPYQTDVWKGCVLVNDAKPGELVHVFSPRLRRQTTVRYPVTQVVLRLEAAADTATDGAAAQEG